MFLHGQSSSSTIWNLSYADTKQSARNVYIHFSLYLNIVVTHKHHSHSLTDERTTCKLQTERP